MECCLELMPPSHKKNPAGLGGSVKTPLSPFLWPEMAGGTQERDDRNGTLDAPRRNGPAGARHFAETEPPGEALRLIRPCVAAGFPGEDRGKAGARAGACAAQDSLIRLDTCQENRLDACQENRRRSARGRP